MNCDLVATTKTTRTIQTVRITWWHRIFPARWFAPYPVSEPVPKGLSARFPRTRRQAPPKMFHDYAAGLDGDADSIVKATSEEIAREERLARERANADGLVAGRHHAEDLQRSSSDELPARLSSLQVAAEADRHSTRLWIKEKFEAIEADAGARLTEHANSLSERLMVIETDLHRWGTDLERSEVIHNRAQGALSVEDSKSYEGQEQQVRFEAWKAELEYDDLRFFVHESTREQARIEERRESIQRFRALLPEKIREAKEEAEASFNAAIESGYRARREELLSLPVNQGGAPLVGEDGKWAIARRWTARVLIVLGALAVLAAAGYFARREIEKTDVPALTGQKLAFASASARNAGLRVTVVGATPGRANQRVCAQVPLPGSRSDSVELIVGRGCSANSSNGVSNVR